ncbi:hypothetical protein LCGC14_2722570, partial [marine sediment metagenome]
VRRAYKTYDGQPFELTEGQEEIFDAIYSKIHKRVHISTYTQYGKSDVVSLAVLTRCSLYPEKWAIIAPNEKKAKIIIGYAIQHLFDNPVTYDRFQIGRDESLERIRRERSKSKLTFRIEKGLIGEMFILSAEAHRTAEVSKALMGFGAANVVEDEAALIPDPIHSTVMRMLGGYKENFLCKIGNPFERNHFLRSYRDPRYNKIAIDWRQGVKEGRITQEFIEEMRQEALFEILYDCKFPEQTAIDAKGYSHLLTDSDLDNSYINDIQLFGSQRLGCDVAGGGKNYSVIVIRGDNGAKVIYKEKNPDTMSFVGIILKLAQENHIPPPGIFIDIVGLGKGVYDRLDEQYGGLSNTQGRVNGINNGTKPENEEDFFNLKAQSYWRLGQWIKQGGKLKRHKSWEELLNIKYKVQSDRKIKMKPKEETLREGIM